MTTENAAATERPPQFGLADLMVAMLSASLLFALLKACQPSAIAADDAKSGREYLAICGALACVYWIPLHSLVWAALFGWRPGARFPRQPGHWLLLQTGITFCERALTLSIAHRVGGNQMPLILPFLWLPTFLLAVIASIKTHSRPWKAAFVLLAEWRILVLTFVAFIAASSSDGNRLIADLYGLLGVGLLVTALILGGMIWPLRPLRPADSPPENLMSSADVLHFAGIFFCAVDQLLCCALPVVN